MTRTVILGVAIFVAVLIVASFATMKMSSLAYCASIAEEGFASNAGEDFAGLAADLPEFDVAIKCLS